MTRVVVALVLIAVVGVIALVVRSRRSVDPPTQRSYHVPEQLDRADFDRADAPWLVAVFTSNTCDLCRGVVDRAQVLASGEVAVAEVDYDGRRPLHEKYRIDAVPTLVVCDAEGVVRAGFLGPVNATDLWAAVAEVREPGSTPQDHQGHDGRSS